MDYPTLITTAGRGDDSSAGATAGSTHSGLDKSIPHAPQKRSPYQRSLDDVLVLVQRDMLGGSESPFHHQCRTFRTSPWTHKTKGVPSTSMYNGQTPRWSKEFTDHALAVNDRYPPSELEECRGSDPAQHAWKGPRF